MRGICCLLISVRKDSVMEVGPLGQLEFRKGAYCYVGSAQNGLEARVRRHLSKKKRPLFWHVDYLLADRSVSVKEVFCKLGAGKEEECKTARKMTGTPIENFGCSDCKCASHLFFLSPGTSRRQK